MPSLVEHCIKSQDFYGVDGREIHQWMDSLVTVKTGSHRDFRHSLHQQLPKKLVEKYGEEVAYNIMQDHIIQDSKTPRGVEEINSSEFIEKIIYKDKIIEVPIERIIEKTIEKIVYIDKTSGVVVDNHKDGKWLSPETLGEVGKIFEEIHEIQLQNTAGNIDYNNRYPDSTLKVDPKLAQEVREKHIEARWDPISKITIFSKNGVNYD